MQLSLERYHVLLGAAWVMIRMKMMEVNGLILKIQEYALTISGYDTSFFPPAITLVWPDWCALLVAVYCFPSPLE